MITLRHTHTIRCFNLLVFVVALLLLLQFDRLLFKLLTLLPLIHYYLPVCHRHSSSLSSPVHVVFKRHRIHSRVCVCVCAKEGETNRVSHTASLATTSSVSCRRRFLFGIQFVYVFFFTSLSLQIETTTFFPPFTFCEDHALFYSILLSAEHSECCSVCVCASKTEPTLISVSLVPFLSVHTIKTVRVRLSPCLHRFYRTNEKKNHTNPNTQHVHLSKLTVHLSKRPKNNFDKKSWYSKVNN